MWIENLKISNCRLIKDTDIVLAPDLNIIYGKNASGKTSLLEALSLLSSGKSFRTSHIKHVISHEKKSVLVSARLNTIDSHTQIGIEKDVSKTRIRINKKDIYTQAELSHRLPITIIHPESIELIIGPPSFRRSYIDWIAFYLYPEFHKTWKSYQHILKQRNLCLKDSKHLYALQKWTDELINLQPEITQFRIEAISSLQYSLNNVSNNLLGDKSVDIIFKNGFPTDVELNKKSLQKHYADRKTYDLKIKRTSSGVHRADIKIMLDGSPAIESASRGQLKLLAITLLLAQSSTIISDSKDEGIIAIDDLAAELDEKNKNKLLNYLSTLNKQLIITTTKEMKLTNIPFKLFHVKHGVIKEI